MFAKCGGIWYNINMEKDIFTIKRNTLSYGRGYVYSLQYHLVWCTKYRKQVLKNGIDAECKKMLYELAEEYKFKILAMEVMPDHIHLLVDCRPQVLAYIEGQKENESSRKRKCRSAVSYLVQVYMGGMFHAIADY